MIQFTLPNCDDAAWLLVAEVLHEGDAVQHGPPAPERRAVSGEHRRRIGHPRRAGPLALDRDDEVGGRRSARVDVPGRTRLRSQVALRVRRREKLSRARDTPSARWRTSRDEHARPLAQPGVIDRAEWLRLDAQMSRSCQHAGHRDTLRRRYGAPVAVGVSGGSDQRRELSKQHRNTLFAVDILLRVG